MEMTMVLDDLDRQTDVHRDLGSLQVFTNNDQMIPLNGEANLLALIDILDEEFALWNPSTGRPVRLYFLDYGAFLEVTNRVNRAMLYLWPGLSIPSPKATYAYFVPLTTGEDVIISYTWEWSILLHEIMHLVLTEQVSLSLGTNHGAVIPEASRLWHSPEVQRLVATATRGEHYK